MSNTFNPAHKIKISDDEHVTLEDLYQAFKVRMTQELSLGKSTSNYSCVNTTGGLKGRFDR